MANLLYNLIKSIDIFHRPVTLRFKNADVFKTFCGGMMSLVMTSIILNFFIMKSLEVYHGKIQHMVQSIVPRLQNDNAYTYMKSTVLGVAFEDPEIDESYIKFEIGVFDLKENVIKYKNSRLQECTTEMFDKSLPKDVAYLPEKLKVLCFKIDEKILKQDNNPFIQVKLCHESSQDRSENPNGDKESDSSSSYAKG